jgi:hypothetical protein
LIEPSPGIPAAEESIDYMNHLPDASLEAATQRRAIVDEASLPRTVAKMRLKNAWAAIRAALGSLLGLVPHVMHHIGIVVGTALLAGFWGNTILYLLGILLSIPMFRRLHRRYGSITAPIAGAAIFTALFLFSALVVGPAINASAIAPGTPTISAPADPGDGHAAHHR